MPTGATSSFSAARDFARSFPRGSRLASSATQDNLVPSPFTPGAIGPEVALAKFSQLILTTGARRRRAQLEQALYDQQIEKDRLNNQRLSMLADPNYVPAGQREANRLRDEGNAETARYHTAQSQHQSAVDAERIRHDRALEGQAAANERGRTARAADRKAQSSQYRQAVATRDDLLKERQRAIDAAEEVALGHVQNLKMRALGPAKSGGGFLGMGAKDTGAGAARDSLGVSRQQDLAKHPLPQGSGNDLVERAKKRAAAMWDQANAGKLARLHGVIASGLPLDDGADAQDEWEQTMMKAFGGAPEADQADDDGSGD